MATNRQKGGKAETAASRAWNAAHRQACAEAQARYEAANPEKTKEAKRKWWRKNKGQYGSWADYVHQAKLTGGLLIDKGEYKGKTADYRARHGYDPRRLKRGKVKW